MKKIMILGTGDAQLNLIKESKLLGYVTIVCGLRPEREAAKIADKYYEVDYLDLDKIFDIAISEGIDGIISNAEPAMVNVASISERLNLVGNSTASIEILSSKAKFRELQHKAGCFSPEHCVVCSCDDLLLNAKKMKYPLIIKPTESTGTQGTIRINEYDETLLKNSFYTCKEYSRNDLVSMEQYIPMNDLRVYESDIVVVGEDIIWDGMMWTDRSKEAPMVPRTYIFPMATDEEIKNKLQSTIKKLLVTAGIRHGEYNVEAYFTEEDEVFVIEINPRQGGNYIPQLIQQHSGVNLSKLIVSTAVGDMEYYNSLKDFNRENNYITLHVVFSKTDGLLKDIFISPELESHIKWIDRKVELGSVVKKGINAFDAIACVDMEFNSFEEQHKYTDRIEEYIYPIVE